MNRVITKLTKNQLNKTCELTNAFRNLLNTVCESYTKINDGIILSNHYPTGMFICYIKELGSI